MTPVLLGLGANLADRRHNLVRALQMIRERAAVKAVSSLYDTEPVGIRDQPRFLNAACLIDTQEPPAGVLAWCKEVEAALGRTYGTRFGPRPADVDVLLYGDWVVATPDLVIPHPRMAVRPFVLVPAAEVAPGMVHPVLGRTVGQLLAAVSGTSGVRLVEAGEWWKE